MEEQMQVGERSFRVIRLLGKGKGGYSYLVEDDAGQYVLKQIHHEPCAYYTFGNKMEAELRDYARLVQIGIRMPKMLGVDMERERILKEYVEGESIYDLLLRDQMRPEYVDQVRAMCEKLYPAGLNIDYFPTNFIVQGGEIHYIDYECNGYMDQWNFENWGSAYWRKTEAFIQYVREHA